MKRNLKIAAFSIVVIIIVILVLISNRSKLEEKIKDDKYAKFPVTVLSAESKSVSDELILTGNIEANNEIALLSETDGRILKMSVNIGDFVKKGALIATVDSELKAANLMVAEANYEKALKDLARYETLLSNGNATEMEIENARLTVKSLEAQLIIAKRLLSNTKIISPVSGVISEKYANTGSTLAPGTPLVNILDISQLKVKLQLPEEDLLKFKKGDVVEVTTSLFPETVFKGTVRSILGKGDASHTYPLEISLESKKNKELKAGMFVTVKYVSNKMIDAIPIPRSSLIGSIKDPAVYLVVDGKAKKRPVKIIKDSGKEVLISEGLSQGDPVVLSGQNNLTEGVPVDIKNKSALGK
jgi:RND family efflux transporter MFP subunit